MDKDTEDFIINSIKNFYLKYGITYSEISIEKWVIHYFNFRLRYIPSNTRDVYVSNELTVKIDTHAKKIILHDIIKRLTKGLDINPYQSTRLMDVEFDDELYNDWGIHHLHLSNSPNPKSSFFYERTGELLFIKFFKNEAYLLDTLPHGCFSKKSLIGIIQNNWNEIIEPFEMKDAIEIEQDLNEDEIYQLRKVGVNFPIKVNGKIYSQLGAGVAASKDNIQATEYYLELLRWLDLNIGVKDSHPELFKDEILKLLYL